MCKNSLEFQVKMKEGLKKYAIWNLKNYFSFFVQYSITSQSIFAFAFALWMFIYHDYITVIICDVIKIIYIHKIRLKFSLILN